MTANAFDMSSSNGTNENHQENSKQELCLKKHGDKEPVEKKYRYKNELWHCTPCEVYCNSDTQFQVHMMSRKHKLGKIKKLDSIEGCEEQNSSTQIDIKDETNVPFDDDLASQWNINLSDFQLPQNRQVGKFSKFGFFCKECNVYMTGQMQLVMHVRGLRHQNQLTLKLYGYTIEKSPYKRSFVSPTHHFFHSPFVSHNTSLLHMAHQNSSLQQFYQQQDFLFPNSPSHQYQSPPSNQNQSFNIQLTPRPPNHNQQYQLHHQRKSLYIRQPQLNFSPVKFTSPTPNHLNHHLLQSSITTTPQPSHQTQNMMYNFFSPNYSFGNEIKQQALFDTSFEHQQSPQHQPSQIQEVYYQTQVPQLTATLWPATNINLSPPLYSNGNDFFQN